MMQFSVVSSLVSLALVLSTASAQMTTDKCSDVHVFLAKGNNEPYPGRQGKLAAAICAGLRSCDYEDIQFFNPLPAPYCDSVTEGQANGVKQITAYNKRCPKSKLVVSGYSQGGHVLGDVLSGGGGVFFENCVQPSSEGLTPNKAPGNKIVAALIFGDVRHTANQPFNVLAGSGGDGLFPRTGRQLANLNAWKGVLRAYCAGGDPICAGGDVVDEHLNYFDVYTGQAASWVKSKLGKDGEEETTTTTVLPPPPPEKTSLMTSRKTSVAASTSKAESTTTAKETSTVTTASSASETSTEARTSDSSDSDAEAQTQTQTQTRTQAAESTTADEAEPTESDNAAAPLVGGGGLASLVVLLLGGALAL